MQNQVIDNIYTEVEEFDGTISAYDVFEKSHEEPESTITLFTTFWNNCECFGEDDDCP